MIKEQFSLACTFLKERVRKPWLIILVLFVVIWFGFGFFVSLMGEEEITDFVLAQDTSVQMAIVGSEGEGTYAWYEYFLHNGTSDVVGLVAGLIPFIPVGIFIELFNAIIWGLMAGLAGSASGFFGTLVFGMLPHCIFEMPANTLATALSFVLFVTVTKRILKKTDEKIGALFVNCLRVFVFFVLPLLLVGGIVEGCVTPVIVANTLL